jgi:hypothetical protein
MIQRRRALRALLTAVALTHVGTSTAGVWILTPRIGIVGEYSTNPALLYAGRNSGVTGGALQIDAPISFQGDAIKLSVLPSIRQSNASGYSAVTSDYGHLKLAGQYSTPTSTLSASGAVTRDSSLAYNNLSSGTAGVRRDALSAELNWDQHLTERVEYQLDANTQRVNFGHSPGVSPLQLIDYEYSNAAPGLTWNSSPRNKVALTASISRYNSIDSHDVFGGRYATESRSINLQLGFVRQLAELWTFSALGGYSRALNEVDSNQYHLFFIPPNLILQIVPVRNVSSQDGSIYAAQLNHKGTLLELSAVASRQLEPTGFAYLSRQDTYEINAAYTLSERWSFSVDARLVRHQNSTASQNAPNNFQDADVYTRYVTAAANWHWTERWIFSLAVSRVSENVQFSQYDVASNELTLSLNRQFDPVAF